MFVKVNESNEKLMLPQASNKFILSVLNTSQCLFIININILYSNYEFQ